MSYEGLGGHFSSAHASRRYPALPAAKPHALPPLHKSLLCPGGMRQLHGRCVPGYAGFGAYGTPVNRDQIVTVQQAADYAYGSYKSALSKCPNAAGAYKELLDNVESTEWPDWDAELVGAFQETWNVALETADQYCRGNLAKSAVAPSTPPKTGAVGPSVGPMGPPPSVGGGSSGIMWLVLGAAAFFLMQG